MTLEVESALGPETPTTIHCVLKYIQKLPPKVQIETEFVERRGILHISRMRLDEQVNKAERDISNGADPEVRDLHDSETCIRFRCERIGTLDSLHYVEVSAAEFPMRDDCVEVEIMAAGVNFKVLPLLDILGDHLLTFKQDVAVSMGIVPENEHLLGLEGSGIIRRLGKTATPLKMGQRVLVYEKGAFVNRIQLTPERVYPLPHSMSFEVGSCEPSLQSNC